MICSCCEREIVDDAAYCPYCNTPVEGGPSYDDYEYEAFISYRHLPHDRDVAVKLQRALEGFVVPRNMREQLGRKRLGRLFRDEDELPTSSSLSDQIKDALRRSRYLIVVCSPRTNESMWVSREVELFSSYHGRDKVRIALAEAEPDDSFPLLLRTRLERDADGNVVEVPEEPLAADFRDLSRKKFNLEKLRMAAPLLDCGFDDLRQRMRARRMRVAGIAAAAVTAVSVGFGSFSTYQQFQIQENYRQAQIKESEFLATESATLLAQGNRMEAIQVAAAALPESETVASRPYVPAAQLALENALEVYPSESYWRPLFSLNDNATGMIAVDDSGQCAYIGDDRLVHIVDVASTNQVATIDVEAQLELKRSRDNLVESMVLSNGALLITRSNLLACFDAATGEARWGTLWEDLLRPDDVAVSPKGTKACAVHKAPRYTLSAPDECSYMAISVDMATGTTLNTVLLPIADEEADAKTGQRAKVAFLDDTHVAVAGSGTMYLVDLETGAVSHTALAEDYAYGISCFGNIIFAISQPEYLLSNQETVVEAFDASLNPLWSYRATIGSATDTGFNADGVSYIRDVRVRGLWESNYFERPQAIVQFDNRVLLFDVQTGDISFESEFGSPVASCAVGRLEETQVLLVATKDGEVAWRLPDKNVVAGSIYDDAINKLYGAEFTNDAQGNSYLIASDLTTYDCSVYRCSGKSDVADMTRVDALNPSQSYLWNDDARILEIGDDTLRLYDTVNDVVMFEVPKSSLVGIDTSQCAFALSDDGLVYVYGKALGTSDKACAVCALAMEDGSVRTSFTVEGLDGSAAATMGSLTAADDDSVGRLLVLTDFYRTMFVNGETGAVVNDVSRGTSLSRVWCCDDKLIVCESGEPDEGYGAVRESGEGEATPQPKYESEAWNLALVDRSTGVTVPSDINGVVPLYKNGEACASLSGDASRFVVACADGAVRMFDTSTGKLVWESFDVPSGNVFLAFSPETNNVFMQDESGACLLLAAADGSALATSSTTLPPIQMSYRVSNGDTLAVRWQRPGMSVKTGVALISLDPESFGPKTSIPSGFFIGDGGKFVLTLGYGQDFIGRIPLYTLDELLAKASETTEGHKLTDAQRHLYHVDG